jgi:WhiB family transcriptional regulator, redox-sensing transcriptional regulator
VPRENPQYPHTKLDRSFMEHAKCVDYDPEYWFPEGPEAPYMLTRALQICDTCPVTDRCFAYGVAAGCHDGVWGGVLLSTERARRARGAVKVQGQRVPAAVVAPPEEEPAWWRTLIFTVRRTKRRNR